MIFMLTCQSNAEGCVVYDILIIIHNTTFGITFIRQHKLHLPSSIIDFCVLLILNEFKGLKLDLI